MVSVSLLEIFPSNLGSKSNEEQSLRTNSLVFRPEHSLALSTKLLVPIASTFNTKLKMQEDKNVSDERRRV
jgi:hypothetical protein